MFAQAVARGVKTDLAYRDAGYKGGDQVRRALRQAKDIDARINYLLERQVRDHTKARHKREIPAQDRKARILSQLEAIAFSDIRDAVQWERVPVLNDDGSVQGFRDIMVLTPSANLTTAQAAGIKKVFTKGGELNVEWHEQLGALEKLARIEGMFVEGAPTTVNNTVNQVNIGSTPALEAVRRLAFAIQKAQHAQPLIDVTPASDVTSE